MGLGLCRTASRKQFDMSENKPHMGDLAVELDELTWSQTIHLAGQLGMKFAKLRKIDESKQRDDIKLMRTMDAWLKSDQDASWKNVVRALNATQENDLARNLETRYCRPAPTSRSAADALHAVGQPALRHSRPAVNAEASAPSIPRACEGNVDLLMFACHVLLMRLRYT